jgi:gas vesicle protein
VSKKQINLSSTKKENNDIIKAGLAGAVAGAAVGAAATVLTDETKRKKIQTKATQVTNKAKQTAAKATTKVKQTAKELDNKVDTALKKTAATADKIEKVARTARGNASTGQKSQTRTR